MSDTTTYYRRETYGRERWYFADAEVAELWRAVTGRATFADGKARVHSDGEAELLRLGALVERLTGKEVVWIEVPAPRR